MCVLLHITLIHRALINILDGRKEILQSRYIWVKLFNPYYRYGSHLAFIFYKMCSLHLFVILTINVFKRYRKLMKNTYVNYIHIIILFYVFQATLFYLFTFYARSTMIDDTAYTETISLLFTVWHTYCQSRQWLVILFTKNCSDILYPNWQRSPLVALTIEQTYEVINKAQSTYVYT